MNHLPKRARSILYAVVTEFIATGEPVGSRTLAKKYGFDLSAATIRNVLADLEDAGYLAQPHTSAGRVPTEAAFRIFIDALMRVRQLSADDVSKITEWFADMPPGADILRETGRLLSEMANAPAVIVRSRAEQRTLVKVRFIPTRVGEVLSVVVLSDGTVENRFIAVERPLLESELERLHNMLEEVTEGRTLAAVREYFAQSLNEHRDELAALKKLGFSLMTAAIACAPLHTSLVIEGQSRLFDQPEFSNAEHVRELMRALEDRESIVSLLDRTLATSRVQVFLGQETTETVGYPMTVIAAPYHEEDGSPAGAVGIIGPTRMDYPAIVPLVGATADAMSLALARSRDGGNRGARD
ncbi:MAG TPA: heat-inducible transcriptional repressor HrcA [Polyangiaceae bacterium]